MEYDYLCRTERWLSIRSFKDEVWKDVPASIAPGYQVSNMGRVRSVNEKGFAVKVCKPSPDTKGYCRVHIGKRCIKVHRLIAQMFVANPDNKPMIDHINGDKGDNRAENLRWVTQEENANNPITRDRQEVSLAKNRNKGREVAILSKSGEVTAICSSVRKAGELLGKPFESISFNLRYYGVYKACVSDEMYSVKRTVDIEYQYELF